MNQRSSTPTGPELFATFPRSLILLELELPEERSTLSPLMESNGFLPSLQTLHCGWLWLNRTDLSSLPSTLTSLNIGGIFELFESTQDDRLRPWHFPVSLTKLRLKEAPLLPSFFHGLATDCRNLSSAKFENLTSEILKRKDGTVTEDLKRLKSFRRKTFSEFKAIAA